jgi:hypothetical protein
VLFRSAQHPALTPPSTAHLPPPAPARRDSRAQRRCTPFVFIHHRPPSLRCEANAGRERRSPRRRCLRWRRRGEAACAGGGSRWPGGESPRWWWCCPWIFGAPATKPRPYDAHAFARIITNAHTRTTQRNKTKENRGTFAHHSRCEYNPSRFSTNPKGLPHSARSRRESALARNRERSVPRRFGRMCGPKAGMVRFGYREFEGPCTSNPPARPCRGFDFSF